MQQRIKKMFTRQLDKCEPHSQRDTQHEQAAMQRVCAPAPSPGEKTNTLDPLQEENMAKFAREALKAKILLPN